MRLDAPTAATTPPTTIPLAPVDFRVAGTTLENAYSKLSSIKNDVSHLEQYGEIPGHDRNNERATERLAAAFANGAFGPALVQAERAVALLETSRYGGAQAFATQIRFDVVEPLQALNAQFPAGKPVIDRAFAFDMHDRLAPITNAAYNWAEELVKQPTVILGSTEA